MIGRTVNCLGTLSQAAIPECSGQLTQQAAADVLQVVHSKTLIARTSSQSARQAKVLHHLVEAACI